MSSLASESLRGGSLLTSFLQGGVLGAYTAHLELTTADWLKAQRSLQRLCLAIFVIFLQFFSTFGGRTGDVNLVIFPHFSGNSARRLFGAL